MQSNTDLQSSLGDNSKMKLNIYTIADHHYTLERMRYLCSEWIEDLSEVRLDFIILRRSSDIIWIVLNYYSCSSI